MRNLFAALAVFLAVPAWGAVLDKYNGTLATLTSVTAGTDRLIGDGRSICLFEFTNAAGTFTAEVQYKLPKSSTWHTQLGGSDGTVTTSTSTSGTVMFVLAPLGDLRGATTACSACNLTIVYHCADQTMQKAP